MPEYDHLIESSDWIDLGLLVNRKLIYSNLNSGFYLLARFSRSDILS